MTIRYLKSLDCAKKEEKQATGGSSARLSQVNKSKKDSQPLRKTIIKRGRPGRQAALGGQAADCVNVE